MRHVRTLDQVVDRLGHVEVDARPHVGQHRLAQAIHDPGLSRALGRVVHLFVNVRPHAARAVPDRRVVGHVAKGVVVQTEPLDKLVEVGKVVQVVAVDNQLQERVLDHVPQLVRVHKLEHLRRGALLVLGQPEVDKGRDARADLVRRTHGPLVEHPQVGAAAPAVHDEHALVPKLLAQHPAQQEDADGRKRPGGIARLKVDNLVALTVARLEVEKLVVGEVQVDDQLATSGHRQALARERGAIRENGADVDAAERLHLEDHRAQRRGALGLDVPLVVVALDRKLAVAERVVASRRELRERLKRKVVRVVLVRRHGSHGNTSRSTGATGGRGDLTGHTSRKWADGGWLPRRARSPSAFERLLARSHPRKS